MQTPPTRLEQFTGRHMLFALPAFFGVIIIVNLTMAAFVARSWTGDITYHSGAVALAQTDKAGQ